MKRNSVFEVLGVKKISSHPLDHLQSVLEVSSAGIKVRWVEEEKNTKTRKYI